MTPVKIRARIQDRDALAITMHREAVGDQREGGSSLEERVAVGCVVRNRYHYPRRYGTTYKAVCLARAQFSCWWEFGGRENYKRTYRDAELLLTEFPGDRLAETVYLAEGIILGRLRDITAGATHYYAPRAMVPRDTIPLWAVGLTPSTTIGSHLFFREVA